MLHLLMSLLPWLFGVVLLYSLLYQPNRWCPAHHLLVIGSGVYVGHITLALILGQLATRGIPVFSIWLVAWAIFLVVICWIIGKFTSRLSKQTHQTHETEKRLNIQTQHSITLLIICATWLLLILGTTIYENAVRPTTAWDSLAYWTLYVDSFLDWQLQGLQPDESPYQVGHLHPSTMHLINIWGAWAANASDASNWLFAPFSLAYVGIVFISTGLIWAQSSNALLGVIAGLVIASLPLVNAHIALAGYTEIWLFSGTLILIALLALPAGSAGKIAVGLGLFTLVVSLALWKSEAIIYSLIGIGAFFMALLTRTRSTMVLVLILATIIFASVVLHSIGFDLDLLGAQIAWLPDENLLRLGRRTGLVQFSSIETIMKNIWVAWTVSSSFSFSVLLTAFCLCAYAWLIFRKKSIGFLAHFSFFLTFGMLAFFFLAPFLSDYLLEYSAPSNDTIFSRSTLVGLPLVFITSVLIGIDLVKNPDGRKP